MTHLDLMHGRVAAGHTVHQMRQLAGVKCDADCRECRPRRVVTITLPRPQTPDPIAQSSPPVPEPALADSPY